MTFDPFYGVGVGSLDPYSRYTATLWSDDSFWFRLLTNSSRPSVRQSLRHYVTPFVSEFRLVYYLNAVLSHSI